MRYLNHDNERMVRENHGRRFRERGSQQGRNTEKHAMAAGSRNDHHGYRRKDSPRIRRQSGAGARGHWSNYSRRACGRFQRPQPHALHGYGTCARDRTQIEKPPRIEQTFQPASAIPSTQGYIKVSTLYPSDGYPNIAIADIARRDPKQSLDRSRSRARLNLPRAVLNSITIRYPDWAMSIV